MKTSLIKVLFKKSLSDFLPLLRWHTPLQSTADPLSGMNTSETVKNIEIYFKPRRAICFKRNTKALWIECIFPAVSLHNTS